MSTRHILAFLAITAAASLSVGAQQPAPAADPAAQPAPAPKAAPPPADPFIRGAKPAPPSPQAQAAAPVNLVTTVERWSMSQADFLAVLEGPADQAAAYARLEELAKAGKARLLGLTAVSTKSGQRAVTDAFDEVRYPVEFDAAQRAGEIPFPVSFETRNAGDTLEVEAVLAANGRTIDLSIARTAVRLGGFQEWRAEATAEPIARPIFHTAKATTSIQLSSGKPSILATATPVAGDAAAPSETQMLIVRVSAQTSPPAPPLKKGDPRVEFLLYTLDRGDAREILAKYADSEKSHAAVRELVATGKAQVEVARALVTRSGQRAVVEEITEVPYPEGGMNPPKYGSSPTPVRAPASFSKFQTRNVGLTIECEPVIDEEGRYVDINIVPQMVSYNGTLKGEGVVTRYPAQPLFTTRKITTSAVGALGAPLFLGTMNQPGNSGVNNREDTGKISLAYIRVTPITP